MRYGAREVLDGVDLDVRRGEVLTLLGPNGAGKSTTIEILEGFRRRSGGQVSVLGADPDDVSDAWRSRIGIVVQSWRDHARWRVGELMEHFARYYPNPRSPGELLDAVGLTAQAKQECHRLSGGQRRRLDVALGIIGRPELLFLDEPTTGFDPEARRDFHSLIERLSEAEGMTIVLTTHDLAEAERLSDSIAILVGGRLIASGPVEGLAAEIQADAEVRWIQNGERRSRLTADPSQVVWELHHEFDGPIPGLEVRRPTLEDTYLGVLRQENA
ncbi:ABC transporter ATP-binding protein [Streptomyces europaeiscabiei]|uniref:ABC transporter ATP-binding protein n=1 Tax=Streptomyces europaeiscabiei TaxID=146819 RepID=UPI0038F6A7A9